VQRVSLPHWYPIKPSERLLEAWSSCTQLASFILPGSAYLGLDDKLAQMAHNALMNAVANSGTTLQELEFWSAAPLSLQFIERGPFYVCNDVIYLFCVHSALADKVDCPRCTEPAIANAEIAAPQAVGVGPVQPRLHDKPAAISPSIASS